MNAKQIAIKYQGLIGSTNSYVSFLHTTPALEAAELLAQAPAEYVDLSVYNFVYRLGQVLYDARFFVAVRHEAAGVYSFVPSAL
jgi:hypothetical protein